MSDTIEVEMAFAEEPAGTEIRPEQQVMCLALGGKTIFLEWGSVIAAVATQIRPSPDLYEVEFMVRGGGMVKIGPCGGEEMAVAINHVFGKKEKLEDILIEDGAEEAPEAS